MTDLSTDLEIARQTIKRLNYRCQDLERKLTKAKKQTWAAVNALSSMLEQAQSVHRLLRGLYDSRHKYINDYYRSYFRRNWRKLKLWSTPPPPLPVPPDDAVLIKSFEEVVVALNQLKARIETAYKDEFMPKPVRKNCLICGEYSSGHVEVRDVTGTKIVGRVCSSHTLWEVVSAQVSPDWSLGLLISQYPEES